LMSLKEGHYTLATGWMWALTGQNAENKELSTELVSFLTADDFLSQWIQESGYLPTQRSFTDQGADSPVPAVIEAMQAGPSSETVLALGPAIQDALVRVLNGEQPEAVARDVVEKLK